MVVVLNSFPFSNNSISRYESSCSPTGSEINLEDPSGAGEETTSLHGNNQELPRISIEGGHHPSVYNSIVDSDTERPSLPSEIILSTNARTNSTERKPNSVEESVDSLNPKSAQSVLLCSKDLQFLRCGTCHYQTQIKSLLDDHMTKHSVDLNFHCPSCNFCEPNGSVFVDHFATHYPGKTLKCYICNKRMTKSNLKRHMIVHKPVKLYDCSMCEFSTNYVGSIKRHTELLHEKEHKCCLCDLIMTKHELQLHLKADHPSEHSPSQSDTILAKDDPSALIRDCESIDQSSVVCRLSQEHAATSVENKHQHSTTLSMDGSAEDNAQCSSLTNSNSLVQSHVEETTENDSRCLPEPPNSDISGGTSNLMNGAFTKWDSSLNECTSKFSRKTYSHCSKCPFKTKRKQLLKRHVTKHLIDNSFVCSNCGYKDMETASFIKHLRSHNPTSSIIKCCFCGYKAQLRHRMAVHIQAHRPVQLNDCPKCEYSPLGGRPDGLRNHIKNFHFKKYNCTFCKKEMTKFNIERHVKKCSQNSSKDNDHVNMEMQDNEYDHGINQDIVVDSCVSVITDTHLDGLARSLPANHHQSGSHDNNSIVIPEAGSAYDKLPNPNDNIVCPEDQVVENSAGNAAHGRKVCQYCKQSYALSYIQRHFHRCFQKKLGAEPETGREGQWPNEAFSEMNENYSMPSLPTKFSSPQPIDFSNLLSSGLGNCHVIIKRMASAKKSFKKCTINDRSLPQEKVSSFMKASRDKRLDKPVLCCSKCTYLTKKRHLLKKHVVKHLKDSRLECPSCGYQEIRSSTFVEHIQTHQESERTFNCCFCDSKPFSDCFSLVKHLRKHRPVTFVDCSKCEFSTYRNDYLKIHNKKFHTENCTCRTCGVIMDQYKFSKHMATAHKTTPEPTQVMTGKQSCYTENENELSDNNNFEAEPFVLGTTLLKQSSERSIQLPKIPFQSEEMVFGQMFRDGLFDQNSAVESNFIENPTADKRPSISTMSHDEIPGSCRNLSLPLVQPAPMDAYEDSSNVNARLDGVLIEENQNAVCTILPSTPHSVLKVYSNSKLPEKSSTQVHSPMDVPLESPVTVSTSSEVTSRISLKNSSQAVTTIAMTFIDDGYSLTDCNHCSVGNTGKSQLLNSSLMKNSNSFEIMENARVGAGSGEMSTTNGEGKIGLLESEDDRSAPIVDGGPTVELTETALRSECAVTDSIVVNSMIGFNDSTQGNTPEDGEFDVPSNVPLSNQRTSQYVCNEQMVISVSSDSEDSYGSSYPDSDANRINNSTSMLQFDDLIQNCIKSLLTNPIIDDVLPLCPSSVNSNENPKSHHLDHANLDSENHYDRIEPSLGSTSVNHASHHLDHASLDCESLDNCIEPSLDLTSVRASASDSFQGDDGLIDSHMNENTMDSPNSSAPAINNKTTRI